MNDSDDIGTLFHLVSASLDKRSNDILSEKLGIGLSQFRILLALLHEDGQNQASIAESLDQTEASVSRQIRLLSQKKLVETRANPTSRRDKLTWLTNKGLMIGQSALSILNSYHSPVFREISDHDQKALKTILRIIQRHLDKI